jgi:hypothetical protein
MNIKNAKAALESVIPGIVFDSDYDRLNHLRRDDNVCAWVQTILNNEWVTDLFNPTSWNFATTIVDRRDGRRVATKLKFKHHTFEIFHGAGAPHLALRQAVRFIAAGMVPKFKPSTYHALRTVAEGARPDPHVHQSGDFRATLPAESL